MARKTKFALCDCEHSMTLDAKAIAAALGLEAVPAVNTQLCRAQLANFEAMMTDGTPFVAACTQEAPLFTEVLGEGSDAADVAFANIRERAGWSEEGGKATAKIAALLAEAALDIPPAPTVTMTSAGGCLVYGRDETAIEAARQLAGRLDVTVLLRNPDAVPPPNIMDVPIFKGRIVAAKGHLGAFEVVVDDYAPLVVSSRDALAFEAARDNASLTCDLILDLTGGAPLFPAPEKRDGYFRPDPANPARKRAVSKTLKRARSDIVLDSPSFGRLKCWHHDLEVHVRRGDSRA